jgi:hypothetical protein
VSLSESRAAAGVAENQFLSVLGDVLLAAIEGEQEGLSPLVVHPAVADCVPFVVTEAGNGLAELGPHKGECVLHVVAALVEGSRLEVVLRPSEQQLELHRPTET